MTELNGNRIIQSLIYLLNCTFQTFYYNSTINETICIDCFAEKTLIIRDNYKSKIRHSIILSNNLNLQTCDICSRIITFSRPTYACLSCKEILTRFLLTRNLNELIDTYNSAQTDTVVIIHQYWLIIQGAK
jgi:hypothetical protein